MLINDQIEYVYICIKYVLHEDKEIVAIFTTEDAANEYCNDRKPFPIDTVYNYEKWYLNDFSYPSY